MYGITIMASTAARVLAGFCVAYFFFVIAFAMLSPVARAYMSDVSVSAFLVNIVILVLFLLIAFKSVDCMEWGGCVGLSYLVAALVATILVIQMAAVAYVHFNYGWAGEVESEIKDELREAGEDASKEEEKDRREWDAAAADKDYDTSLAQNDKVEKEVEQEVEKDGKKDGKRVENVENHAKHMPKHASCASLVPDATKVVVRTFDRDDDWPGLGGRNAENEPYFLAPMVRGGSCPSVMSVTLYARG